MSAAHLRQMVRLRRELRLKLRRNFQQKLTLPIFDGIQMVR